jgi:UPF0755 protein
VVEPRGPLMPVPGPPPGPSREQIRRRRIVATIALLVGLAVAVVAAKAGLDAVKGEPTPTVAQAPPPPKPLRIVFPEGFTRKEMAARITAVNKIALQKRHVRPRLNARKYLAATRRSALPGKFAGDHKARDLEGFLFPATYEFLGKTTSGQLVKKQLAAFDRAWKQVDMGYARRKNLTRYDVLIIASMVEKETLAPDERPLVAAVIYNRLKARMPLGIDATIRYGLDVPGTEPLHESQLSSDNPYNTRKFPGLPPGPIANPGLASIQAAAHPAKVKYLYFVRKPDRIHHFFTSRESEFFKKACEYGYGCG